MTFSTCVPILVLVLLQGVPTDSAATGTVTGIIQSTNGRPAAGIRVAVTTVIDTKDPQDDALVSQTETDSTGHYRLDNIPSGRYYIQAGLVTTPSYYPGTATKSNAASIPVVAGMNLDGMDFKLLNSPGVRISGILPLGSTGARSSLTLFGATAPPRSDVIVKSGGTFEFLGVPPGRYTLRTVPADAAPPLDIVVGEQNVVVGLPAGPGVKVSGVVGIGPLSPRPANQSVIVIGASPWNQILTATDKEGRFEFANIPPGSYSIRTIPGLAAAILTINVTDKAVSEIAVPGYLELSGRVALEDGQPLPSHSPSLSIDSESISGKRMGTVVRPDGSFRLPLIESSYQINVGNLPAEFSVQSIRYGNVDLMKEHLKLDGTSAPNEIRVVLKRSN